MHVLLITHNVHRGEGQARVNYEIIRHLLAKDHYVTIIAGEVAEELRWYPKFTHLPVRFRGWPTQLLQNEIFSLKASRIARSPRGSADVVLTFGAACRIASDVNGVQFVHSAWLRSPGHPVRTIWKPRHIYQTIYSIVSSLEEKKAFQRAKYLVAPSELTANQIQKLYISSERIHMIPNGVDVNEFRPEVYKGKAPEGPIRGIFIGDLRTNRKNADTVLKSLSRIPDARILFVGNAAGGPYPNMARALGLDRRVEFLGYRKDTPDLIRTSDFLVCPSRFEPFGIVVLEGMASGKPVITAKTVGAAELLTPEAGIVIDDPNDVEALASAMRKLSENATLRESMGNRARQIAEQHTWELMASSYEQLFTRIVKEKSLRGTGIDG